VHGCVAREDDTVRGGHLLEATVFPTLELFLTESQVPLAKKRDPSTNLELFNLSS
jgi:predicted DNA-binding protein with PD1-like motif